MPNRSTTRWPELLSFEKTDDCDRHLKSDATGDGRCIQCVEDEANATFAEYGTHRRESYVDWSVYEHRLEAEVDWLFRRIKELSTARHNDAYYYFHGHSEMIAPPKPTRPKSKKTIGPAQRRRIFERDAYRCRHCGSWERLSIDHMNPESRGGSHDDDNLQTLCKSCNSEKGTKTEEEWRLWAERTMS